jgi:tetratricopeptide (TPR) repeat protein
MKPIEPLSTPRAQSFRDLCAFAVQSSFYLVIWLCFASALFAQMGPLPFTIYGRVSLPEGAPASRITVKVIGPSGLERQALTDDTGRFEIGNLPRGRYSLTAENPADPDQFTDPVEADTSRFVGIRIPANIYLRYRTRIIQTQSREATVVSMVEEAQRVPKPAQKDFEQALNLRSRQKYDQSLKRFDQAIAAFPEYFQAIAQRGHLLVAMGRSSAAAKDFARALELNPKYGPALRGAGMCEFEQGKFAEAIQNLERAANVEPRNAMTCLFLGAANVALDRRAQARAALEKALSLDPSGTARAHVHLANLLIKENQPKLAISELDAYLAAVPKAPDAEKLRAVIAQLRAQIK